MKFSLIVAVVVLALAHGSLAEEAPDLQKLTQVFEEMKTKLTTELSAILNNQDLQAQASAQIQTIAAKVQDQLKAAVSTIEEQVKPLADSMQQPIQAMVSDFQNQMNDLSQRILRQTSGN